MMLLLLLTFGFSSVGQPKAAVRPPPVLNRAEAADVREIITIGINLASSREAVALAQRHRQHAEDQTHRAGDQKRHHDRDGGVEGFLAWRLAIEFVSLNMFRNRSRHKAVNGLTGGRALPHFRGRDGRGRRVDQEDVWTRPHIR